MPVSRSSSSPDPGLPGRVERLLPGLATAAVALAAAFLVHWLAPVLLQ